MTAQFSLPALVLGLTLGTTYGLLGASLVLIHRISGVINFAIGATGAVGAAVVGMLTVNEHVPYWLAFVIGLIVAAAASAVTEAAAVRRLRRAPRLMSLVATLGMAAFLTSLSSLLFSQVDATTTFPSPPGMPTFNVGALIVTPAFSAMLIISPCVVLACVGFLRYSRIGTALRATAANGRLARVIGIPASRMTLLAWGLGGAFAALTAIFSGPLNGYTGGSPNSPDLLLHALAAATIARLRSMPAALAAGLVIGVADQEMLWNSPPPGTSSVLLFALIAVALLLQRRQASRLRGGDNWAAVLPVSPLRVRARWTRALRWSGRAGAFILIAGMALLPQVLSSDNAVSFANVFAFAIIALGVLVVTGMSGHLSLGHVGFAGLGALVSLKVAAATGNYVLALLAAGAAAAVTAAVVGIPALRVRGVMYAVATLGFGLVVQEWLLPQGWAFGTGVEFTRPLIGTLSFESSRGYYEWALIVACSCLLIVARVRRTGLARTVTALRDNEDGARVFTVPVLLRSVQVFGLGGFLAGVGGAVLAGSSVSVTADTFDASLSLTVVAAAVIGGLGFTAGPLLGALFVIGLPQLIPGDAALIASTSLGWLLLVMYLPGGLGSAALTARDAALRRLGVTEPVPGEADPPAVAEPSAGPSPVPATAPARASAAGRRAAASPDAALLVRAACLRKRYGGVHAVRDMSIEVKDGEILGLIGPNGAGKTTVFDILSGFARPDGGTVTLLGRDVTRCSPRRRSELGLVRSFQDARLFPTLTVLETVALAHERCEPSVLRDLVLPGGTRRDARRRAAAAEIIDAMGLGGFAHKRIAELSTGTRRITELACVLALRPRVLLLDEPSAGIAQRESEALAGALHRIRDELSATLVIIEHDVPLVLALADRIVAMDGGRVIADGPGAQVVRHPEVIRAYLGDDPAAVQRSNPVPAN